MVSRLTPFPYFHLLCGYSAPASAAGHFVVVALLTAAVGAAAGVCVVVSLVVVGGVDTSISSRHAMTTGAPVVWRPATSEGPGILLSASMDFPQPLPGIASGPVKSFRAIVDIPKPIRM